METSIRRLQIAALTVVTAAAGLGTVTAFRLTAQAREVKRPVAVVQPSEQNPEVKYGKTVLAL